MSADILQQQYNRDEPSPDLKNFSIACVDIVSFPGKSRHNMFTAVAFSRQRNAGLSARTVSIQENLELSVKLLLES